jgi:hypothetical protein
MGIKERAPFQEPFPWPTRLFIHLLDVVGMLLPFIREG